MAQITTLKRRSEFLRVRGGGRYSAAAFVLEGRPRTSAMATDIGPRFGFTVTKKLGGAVVRNRIRRRLRSAISEIASLHADGTYDYVVVARGAALDHSYVELCAELVKAFSRVATGRGDRRTPPASSSGSADRRPR